MVFREASNLFYSRLRVSRKQLQVKAESAYMTRESRHLGISAGMDTLKYTSIDIDLRVLQDYTVIKSIGILGLPTDMKWLYQFYNDYWIRCMPKSSYAIIQVEGGIGLGAFKEVSWHKRPREDIVKLVGLRVEKGEAPEELSSNNSIGDFQHSEIIRLYKEEGLSMNKIGKKLNRSPQTVSNHIKDHNDSVVRSKFCALCKRVRGKYSEETTNH